jgi:6-phosphogluconolactonase
MNRLPQFVLVSLGIIMAITGEIPSNAGTASRVYIGTYTGAKSKGIYTALFNSQSGALSTPELAIETKSPSFLAVHPTQHVLYAVGEATSIGTRREGTVSAFAMEPKTGKLRLINQQPSGGSGPCHVSIDRSGRCVLVANYGSGSIAALPVGVDGSISGPGQRIQHEGSSVNPRRQEGPHAHFITPDPKSKFALCCDLGLDKVLVYRMNPVECSLVANDPPWGTVKPGSGPRHLVFHPSGKFAYVINEMGSSVTVFGYDPKRGALSEVQSLPTLPADFASESTCAEVQIHPSGKFVYGSNRGHDSIAIFGVDLKSGKLHVIAYESTRGKTPRHFAIDPSAKWLLAENQGSDSVVVFALDPKTGKLSATGQSVGVGAPVCLAFAPVF